MCQPRDLPEGDGRDDFDDEPWRELGGGGISESADDEDLLARPARAAHGLRPGGTHADRGQDRRLSRQGRLNIGGSPGACSFPVLSRRTVRTSISRILTKLGATNRVEIAGEALRRGISPERDSQAQSPRREGVVAWTITHRAPPGLEFHG